MIGPFDIPAWSSISPLCIAISVAYLSARLTKQHFLIFSQSLDLNIPVAVIGTGLGPEKANFLFPPCAPHGENHKELKPTCAHFVATKYGHAG
ncbi:hypothetical protein JHK87_025426 [Glycine soja]|nr:hypothetical protein JHK87_025426 [Glycine soja]